MADGGARKRKWDMPGPGGAPAVPPLPAAAAPLMGSHAAALPAEAFAAAQARAQAAAAASSPAAALAAAQARAQAVAAAAAFAARLSGAAAAPMAAAAAEGVAQAFDLNDLEPLARAALTKRPVHEDVTRKTGCVLHTRRVAFARAPAALVA